MLSVINCHIAGETEVIQITEEAAGEIEADSEVTGERVSR
jgi:hypothetical protein